MNVPDIVVLADGTEKPIEGDVLKELLVLCQKGLVMRIKHFTRSGAAVGHWQERRPRALTESQLECVEGAR